MERRTFAFLLLLMMVLAICVGCGNKVQEQVATQTSEEIVESVIEEKTEEIIESNEEVVENAFEAIEGIADIEVDKDLFDVTITIPKDYIGELTQAELDDTSEEKGYKSATLNSDGSATFVMTKDQHKELLKGVAETIDEALADMVGSDDFPNITSVKANDDYTNFTVTTTSTELSLAESFSVIAYYTYGGMYAIYAGNSVDNIHVDFVNADTGNIIESGDSKDLADE